MAKKENIEKLPTNAQVEKYEMLSSLLDSMLTEMREFSKKKQDEVLNKLKVKMINKVLEQIKDILTDEPTIEFLDLLDDETLPTNGDAVLIIAQYKSALDQFKAKYHSSGRWFTKENPKNRF